MVGFDWYSASVGGEVARTHFPFQRNPHPDRFCRRRSVWVADTTSTVPFSFAEESTIDIKELVPGDIIHISTGDIVPADVRIVNSRHLYVSQATFTGETFAMEKSHDLANGGELNSKGDPLELASVCCSHLTSVYHEKMPATAK